MEDILVKQPDGTWMIWKDGAFRPATGPAPKPQAAVAPKPAMSVRPQAPAAPVPAPVVAIKPVPAAKSQPVALGPIEELRTMTLTDFRRLNPSPDKAAERIREKIDLLRQESYEQEVAGIRAWRQGPVHQQYVTITTTALRDGKPVDSLVAQQATGETMSLPEYRAVLALSRNLER